MNNVEQKIKETVDVLIGKAYKDGAREALEVAAAAMEIQDGEYSGADVATILRAAKDAVA